MTKTEVINKIIEIFEFTEVKMFKDIRPKRQRKILNYLSRQFKYENLISKKIFFIDGFVLTYNFTDKDHVFWELETNGIDFDYPNGEFNDLVLFLEIQDKLNADQLIRR